MESTAYSCNNWAPKYIIINIEHLFRCFQQYIHNKKLIPKIAITIATHLTNYGNPYYYIIKAGHVTNYIVYSVSSYFLPESRSPQYAYACSTSMSSNTSDDHFITAKETSKSALNFLDQCLTFAAGCLDELPNLLKEPTYLAVLLPLNVGRSILNFIHQLAVIFV